ncbi:MAG: hypothetical protein COV99_12210 [Bacteroidetes bacterium CG12_big_fil_rev_8_21_14_0_65_60_17]|nr:MAG: hypothetical protein COV99_12210 [Bacteroidetes bacterium CG12_big_fil_rev_8_21_14_0_65_60_17]
MNTKKIVGFLLIIGFSSLLLLNFGNQVGGYMNFEEAESAGASAHVVGMWVEPETFRYNAADNIFSFRMRDDAGNVRTVHYANPKPANFEDAEQVVIEGKPGSDGVFVADNIIVKCPSKYNDQRALQQTGL